jgi:hypothetical protein
MEKVFLIEKGSRYNSEPLEQICICQTEELADKFIKNQYPFENIYHKRAIALITNCNTLKYLKSGYIDIEDI